MSLHHSCGPRSPPTVERQDQAVETARLADPIHTISGNLALFQLHP